jgi:hypothetical protein
LLYVGSGVEGDHLKTRMPILMDEIFQEVADEVYETTRLRRNGIHTTCDRVFEGVLSMLEACGNAMRFVDTNGRIAWKPTPDLRQYLKNLKRDAQPDLRDV